MAISDESYMEILDGIHQTSPLSGSPAQELLPVHLGFLLLPHAPQNWVGRTSRMVHGGGRTVMLGLMKQLDNHNTNFHPPRSEATEHQMLRTNNRACSFFLF